MIRVLALFLLYTIYFIVVEGEWESEFGATVVGSGKNRNAGNPGEFGEEDLGAPAYFSADHQNPASSMGRLPPTQAPLDCKRIWVECQCDGPVPPSPTPKGGKGRHAPPNFQTPKESADYPANYFG